MSRTASAMNTGTHVVTLDDGRDLAPDEVADEVDLSAPLAAQLVDSGQLTKVAAAKADTPNPKENG